MDAKVRDAVRDSGGAKFRACVFTSRQPQYLQGGAQIAKYQICDGLKVYRALLNLKFKKEKRFRQDRNIGQIIGEINLPRLKFRYWIVR
jgi:hypothetical protein